MKFGVVDCSIEVPEHLREKFNEFPPIFKNCEDGLQDIGPHMKDFARDHNLLKKPRRMVISSFYLQRGPLITPRLQVDLEKGLVLSQVDWFIQYTTEKWFECFVNSVVEARREGDNNTSSSVVAETIQLTGKSSYGYQIMDRSKHSKTQYVVGAEVDKLVNNQNFKNLNVLPSSIFEVEMVKSEVEHRQPIIVGLFILQYGKLTLLQLFYNYFQLFCDPQKYELIEMDTESLYGSELREIWRTLKTRDETTVADEPGEWLSRRPWSWWTLQFFPQKLLSAALEIRSEDTWTLQKGI